jgi:hypothetical protein
MPMPTFVTSESPPFHVATSDPVLDSIKDITPEENPIAIRVSAALTAITRSTPELPLLDFQLWSAE